MSYTNPDSNNSKQLPSAFSASKISTAPIEEICATVSKHINMGLNFVSWSPTRKGIAMNSLISKVRFVASATLLISATLSTLTFVGTTDSHASRLGHFTVPYQRSLDCMKRGKRTDRKYTYASVTNKCDRGYRVKIDWRYASDSKCLRLMPGKSHTERRLRSSTFFTPIPNSLKSC